jgi:hypothetical protein
MGPPTHSQPYLFTYCWGNEGEGGTARLAAMSWRRHELLLPVAHLSLRRGYRQFPPIFLPSSSSCSRRTRPPPLLPPRLPISPRPSSGQIEHRGSFISLSRRSERNRIELLSVEVPLAVLYPSDLDARWPWEGLLPATRRGGLVSPAPTPSR